MAEQTTPTGEKPKISVSEVPNTTPSEPGKPQPATQTRLTVQLPMPEPMSAEQVAEHMDTIAKIVRKEGCGFLAINSAQGLALPQKGGRAANVIAAFPKLAVLIPGTTVPTLQSALDLNNSRKMEPNELTNLVLAGAEWMIKHPGSKSTDVPLNDEFMSIYKARCEKVPACDAPTAPLFTPATKEKAKGRQHD